MTPNTCKFIIGCVYVLILACAVTKSIMAYLGIIPPLSNMETGELAIAYIVTVALPVTYIASVIRDKRRRAQAIADAEQKTLDDVDSMVDQVRVSVEDIKNSNADLAESVDSITSKLNQTLDHLGDLSISVNNIENSIPPTPSAFIPVINSLGQDGKLSKLYDLPLAASASQALADAKASIKARADEGNPVNNPVVTLKPAFSIQDPDVNP